MWRLILFFLFITCSISANNRNYYGLNVKGEQNAEKEITALLQVYPNPFTGGFLNIDLKNAEITELRLTNISGQEVLFIKNTVPIARQKVLLERIPNGIYLIIVKTEKNYLLIKKIIVSLK